MTEQRLINYRGRLIQVENYETQLAQLRNEEKALATMDGTGNRLQRAIIRRTEYEAKMAPVIAAARAEMLAVEEAVNALEVPQECKVLQLRYLKGGKGIRLMKWQDVALHLYQADDLKFQRAAQRLHERALAHISK